MVKNVLFLTLLFFTFHFTFAQNSKVEVIKTGNGFKLSANGKDVFINGMNWDYQPIGTNYNYSLWNQSDDVIMMALDNEMSLLKNMGVNVIRQYLGVPPKWVKYIYEKYGIYTMLNHSFGRYGLTINGKWEPNTDYSNPNVREILLKETKAMVLEYKETPGVLLFLLGNENNYGLFWRGAETENVPMADRKSTQAAYGLYKLFNDAVKELKAIDANHPMAICNGDLLFADIIAKECTDIDILGINSYRGLTFTDLYDRVKKELNKPIILTEFGCDAFNTLTNQEDQEYQTKVLLSNWKEIYMNANGMGKNENSLGGFTFQFSDGWWKTGQTINLDEHDVTASWSNGGYQNDFKLGENNMNEEWFGICAKGSTNERGTYELYPRAAYYALKDIHQFNPYTENATTANALFGSISIADATLKARGDKAVLESKDRGKLYFSNFQANFNTYQTGGSLITTPTTANPLTTTYPRSKGFDHMESFNVGVTARPAPNMKANVQFNILGNVALNPIDEIFYENRGRPITVQTSNGPQQISSNNRVQLYKASYSWDAKDFKLTGFYRTGHYHWGYEGDFFGLYPEANYGPNIDIYNGNAPFGFEMEGKKQIKGLKLAFGPELWWGANPALLLKYSRKIAGLDITGIFHNDITQRNNLQSSFAVPVPKTRKATLTISKKTEKLTFDLGGIWGGQPLNGRTFQLIQDDVVYQDKIQSSDNFGGKMKLTYSTGAIRWYGLASYMGLVANGGVDQTKTFTGWRLKDVGSGNMYNALTGFTYNVGKIQIAPNFLYQKPLAGPISSTFAAPARPRNILDDPFSVRGNRETVGGELLLTYDPTPATWMYEWDNDRMEDAKFAMSADFVYRHLPTVMDAGIGILGNGRTTFVFPGSVPAHDLWEANVRMVSKINHDFGIIGNLYYGNGQANGNDKRIINRLGFDIRTIYKKMKLTTIARFNDWGPFDYHRDFNQTFPLQLIGDWSIEVGKPDWFLMPGTKLGFRCTYRTLDDYSNRYSPTEKLNNAGVLVPDPTAFGFPNGNEWEFRTYIQININN
ncbi:MAG: glycoside hydrolase family 2 TIM barrel-domain containing protein [bacterium]|nr:glycoside hydrolase family 2 TIM barrel-domain containing protein [bacterium]